jgi:hypothetical protein
VPLAPFVPALPVICCAPEKFGTLKLRIASKQRLACVDNWLAKRTLIRWEVERLPNRLSGPP